MFKSPESGAIPPEITTKQEAQERQTQPVEQGENEQAFAQTVQEIAKSVIVEGDIQAATNESNQHRLKEKLSFLTSIKDMDQRKKIVSSILESTFAELNTANTIQKIFTNIESLSGGGIEFKKIFTQTEKSKTNLEHGKEEPWQEEIGKKVKQQTLDLLKEEPHTGISLEEKALLEIVQSAIQEVNTLPAKQLTQKMMRNWAHEHIILAISQAFAEQLEQVIEQIALTVVENL